jgi:hypothetical protein
MKAMFNALLTFLTFGSIAVAWSDCIAEVDASLTIKVFFANAL